MSQDNELQKSVLAEFSWEPSVTAGHIGVTASADVVIFSGHVDNYAKKHVTETAARRVKNVKAVAEEIASAAKGTHFARRIATRMAGTPLQRPGERCE